MRRASRLVLAIAGASIVLLLTSQSLWAEKQSSGSTNTPAKPTPEAQRADVAAQTLHVEQEKLKQQKEAATQAQHVEEQKLEEQRKGTLLTLLTIGVTA